MDSHGYAVLASEVAAEVNKLRSNPRSYIPLIRSARGFFRDKEYCNPSNDFYVLTSEGIAALDEAIRFLDTAAPVAPLQRLDQLDHACAKLAKHLEEEGAVAHGVDEFALEKRLVDTMGEMGMMAENLSFGWKDPKEVVMQMVIDDGIKTRGHRSSLFSTEFSHFGVASGPHKLYHHMTVVNFYGVASTDESAFSGYQIDRSEWPEGAKNVVKNVEVLTQDDTRTVRIRFEFLMPDGKKVLKTKDYTEPIDV